MFGISKAKLIPQAEALPGRGVPIATAARHFVFDCPFTLDVPEGHEVALFAMGCFWGVERLFWQVPGVGMTMAGYAGGYTPNPTYEEVCTGRTGHTEVVRVTFDPARLRYAELLTLFWEGHDPTQGMRQGNDRGTQYRSAIYTSNAAQLQAARASAEAYAPRLSVAGYGPITTEIAPAGPFYWAEEYHQQYLAKNPNGYCGIGGTGISCPIGTGA
ncbi:MAG: peptide-methionine (S)-S-oxide reductase [Rhodobacterales bacterium]|nr:MAG: peptide-methionine (S)-S-oxide reductase [Rhodobacterales bacterium]